jgi:ubiquinone/menaquinone biosynthesis C-methylase UbiE
MGEQSGWQLAGTAPELYERFIVPAFMGTSQELVALAVLQEGERVLDVACGTGIIARLAAQAVGATGTVVGADVNEGMLNMARNASQDHDGVSITWHHSDVATLSFSDASFDVVFCQHSLEFFADRAAGLRELCRVLFPGGRLIIRVWRAVERQPFYIALFEALDRHVRVSAGTPIQAAFQLSSADELRTLVKDAGFRDVHLRFSTNTIRFPSLEEYVLGYLPATPIAKDIAAMNEGARAAFTSDMGTALQDFIDDGGLAVPSESHIVMARK